MSLSLSIHGPLKAEARAQVGDNYSCGVIKISDAEGVDITMFVPDMASAEILAAAINAHSGAITHNRKAVA